MRMAVIYFAGAVALAAAPALSVTQGIAPPKWNPKAPENSQMLPAFSFATVEPVLSGIGARFQRTSDAAKPSLLVVFPNNRKAVLMFGSCNADGACKALSIQSNWTRIANSPPEATARAIEGFNRRYSFAKAYVAQDGRPSLQRYLTADYGFIRGNLAVNMLVFANQAERFATEVLRPLETKK